MANDRDILTRGDLKVLVQSGHELASQVALDVLLSSILSKACELTNSPDSSIIMHNENRNSLYFAAATGNNASMLLNQWGENSEKQIPIHGSKAGQVFSTGKSIVVNALEIDPNHYKGVDKDTKKQTESMVCVPLIISGKPIGAIQLLNKRSGNYSERDQIILEYFADQAAVAIRNARLFVDLLAHMGLYSSLDELKDPLELMAEIEKPAYSEVLTVIFPDMRGFTQFCQVLNNPVTVQERLNEFISMLAEEVLKHNGMVNKFLGDGLMGLFRKDDHASRAVRCAYEMVEKFHEMKKRWDEESNVMLDFLDLGIGIATDDVILGTIGHKRVRDFTAIGNAVNLAAAFEHSARSERRILVDQRTFSDARHIISEFEGPENFELRKPGQSVGHPYKMYHIKKISTGAKINVFISYNQKDLEFVEQQLVKPLNDAGICTWYSRANIKKGSSWVRSIPEGIKECQWMIVVISKNSAASEWVKREVELAFAEGSFGEKIIPVVIDNTELNQVSEWLKAKQAVNVNESQNLVDSLLPLFNEQ
jgi:class 3 adenylate cyclase